MQNSPSENGIVLWVSWRNNQKISPYKSSRRRRYTWKKGTGFFEVPWGEPKKPLPENWKKLWVAWVSPTWNVKVMCANFRRCRKKYLWNGWSGFLNFPWGEVKKLWSGYGIKLKVSWWNNQKSSLCGNSKTGRRRYFSAGFFNVQWEELKKPSYEHKKVWWANFKAD